VTVGDLAAVCAHASAKIEQMAARRFIELGTELTVEVDESCKGALAW
jgi:hypothetical protein